MLRIESLTLGAYQTNCYIVWNGDSRRCLVIDPGYSPEAVLARVRLLGLTVEAVALTHGHFDHVGGVRAIAGAARCPVYLHAGDLSQPEEMTAGPLYYTDLYGEGGRFSAGGLEFSVMSTPGHTPGSVCLLTEDALFSGDTLFDGSCGRTDFPGGSGDQMRRSLARLAAIPGDRRVFPGHGGETTLEEQRQYNPFMP